MTNQHIKKNPYVTLTELTHHVYHVSHSSSYEYESICFMKYKPKSKMKIKHEQNIYTHI